MQLAPLHRGGHVAGHPFRSAARRSEPRSGRIAVRALAWPVSSTQDSEGGRPRVAAHARADFAASSPSASLEVSDSEEVTNSFGFVTEGSPASDSYRGESNATLDEEQLRQRLEELVSSTDGEELASAAASHDDSAADAAAVEAPGGISGSLKGMLLLNLGAALFGSNMVAIKMAEDSMSSTALSAVRFAIAALAFAPFVYRGLRLPNVRSKALELSLWLLGGYTAQAAGLEMTSAARGAFTGTFTVIAVPLLVGFSGRKVSWQTWVAAVVALGGVGMLTSSGGDPTWGDALCIVSATLFGVHKWRSETVTSQVEETTELVAVQLALLAVASAAITAPEILQGIEGHSTGEILSNLAALPWPALLFMGLGTTALTLWIEMTSLKEVSAPLAAVIYTAEPLWGAGLAYWLLGERWGPLGWVGAGLIIASSLGSQLGGDTTERATIKKEA